MTQNKWVVYYIIESKKVVIKENMCYTDAIKLAARLDAKYYFNN